VRIPAAARSATILGLAFGLAAGAVGCTNSESSLGRISVVPPVNMPVRLSADVQPIFTQSCAFAGCHGSTGTVQSLNLEAGHSFANLVNVPSTEVIGPIRVVPGNSASSYLVMKLEGTAPGAQMPSGMPPLPQAEIQLIKDWIDQGATDN